jgi:hypothetical protein
MGVLFKLDISIKLFDMLCRFLSTEKGGHLAETDGTIVRKWKWPVNNVKLTTPINIQVSEVHMFLKVSGLKTNW